MEGPSIERKMIWVNGISFFAFLFLIGKVLLGVISGGFSHALGSIGSSNIDYVMIGIAFPYFLVTTIQSIIFVVNEDDDAEDNT